MQLIEYEKQRRGKFKVLRLEELCCRSQMGVLRREAFLEDCGEFGFEVLSFR